MRKRHRAARQAGSAGVPPALGWGLLAVLAAAGCGGGPDPEAAARIVERLIAEDPQELLAAGGLWPTATVSAWAFDGSAGLDGWEVSPAPAKAAKNRCPGLSLPDGRLTLTRDMDLDAASVQVVRLRLDGLKKGNLALSWAAAGESFSAEKRLRLQSRSGATSFAFGVGADAAWTGRVDRLRIAVAAEGQGKKDLCLREIETLRFDPDAETLTGILKRPWKVELGAEVHNARLSLPGVPIEWPVEVPAAGRLAFGYGLEAGVRWPVRFRVLVRSDEGTERLLFEEEMMHDAAAPWRAAEVDLSPLAGKNERLVFETAAGEDWDPTRGFAVWSNPELLGAAGDEDRPDVVLISVDTLRADHLSLYGYPRPTSPAIDAWARRAGVVFQNAVAPSPWTLPSHVSLLTGLDALSHGVNHTAPADRELTTLAERLRESGYATRAITGGGWMNPLQGLSQGFDHYRFWPPSGQGDELAAGIDRALEILERPGRRPLFLFLHTYAVHEPYVRREPYFSQFYGEDRARTLGEVTVTSQTPKRLPELGFVGPKQLLAASGDGPAKKSQDFEIAAALYDSAVRHADDELGRLLRYLEDSGRERRTAVILTSDHGEALGEKDLGGHAYLYDFNLMVPLIVALPGGEHGGREVAAQVRLTDVFPTVLDLARVQVEHRIDGASLADLLRGGDDDERPAWSYASSSNFGVALRLDNRLKYVFNNTAWLPVRGEEEVYDLRRDRLETDNLAADGRAAADAESLRRRLEGAFTERARGVRMVIDNRAAAPLAGRIGGAMLKPHTVKSLALPPGSELSWDGKSQVSFAVGAGESVTVFLEGAPVGKLHLAASFPGSPRLEQVVSPAALDEPWRAAFAAGSWDLAAASSAPADAALTLAWHGRGLTLADRGTDLGQADSELVEHLKALGYVD